MSKKITALVLALLCLVMCCACGETDKDVRGSVTTPSPTSTPDTPAPTATPEPTEAPADDDFDIGSIEGSTYTNSFIGIGIDLDENWYIATEDELASMNGTLADSFTDEELKEMMADSDSFFDFYAASTDGMVTMNVTMENLGLLYGTVMDEDAYLDASMDGDTLEKSLNEIGIEDIVIEKTTVSFAGAEHKGITISGNVYVEETAIPFYELLVCCKAGNYMACVTMATYIENTTSDLAAMFYAVD